MTWTGQLWDPSGSVVSGDRGCKFVNSTRTDKAGNMSTHLRIVESNSRTYLIVSECVFNLYLKLFLVK